MNMALVNPRPPTATAYFHGRKHHSKSQRRNKSHYHSKGFARLGEGNAVKSTLESLRRHERYRRPTTDTTNRGGRRGEPKRKVPLENQRKRKRRVGSCRSCRSRYRRQRSKNPEKESQAIGGFEQSLLLT